MSSHCTADSAVSTPAAAAHNLLQFNQIAKQDTAHGMHGQRTGICAWAYSLHLSQGRYTFMQCPHGCQHAFGEQLQQCQYLSVLASQKGSSGHTFLSSRPILARSSSLAFTVSSHLFFSSNFLSASSGRAWNAQKKSTKEEFSATAGLCSAQKHSADRVHAVTGNKADWD